jgi:hypothetical protein
MSSRDMTSVRERTRKNLLQFFVLSANFVPFDNGDSVKNFSFGAGRIVGMNIAPLPVATGNFMKEKAEPFKKD